MPGRVVVQYDKRDIETIKLIKLDLLGLRMLSAIDDALRDIAADCGVHVVLDRLPEDIPDVFRMIQAADTVGVFQIESRAQMQTLPRSRPTTLDDLVVEVAIIRPGPIQGNAVHPYLRRRQGKEPVSYLHPSLQPALEETLGVILYQEQVMKIAIDVAGFSAAESDGFRRAMGTWRSSREMEKLHARFVDGCITRSGLDNEQAEELFRQVAAFASFGFNKSHAAAFARTAYESAFLKLFYPGPVRGRADQRPADGLLPGRGAHQRRQAPRCRRAAGRRQPQPLPDDDRMGGHARRATPDGRRHRPPAGGRPVIGLRGSGARGARPLGGANSARLRDPAGPAPGQGHRRGGGRGARSRAGARRPVHVARRSRGTHASCRRRCSSGSSVPARSTRWASRGAGCSGSCARSPARRARPARGRPRGRRRRSTCACRRPMRPIFRHRPSSSAWAMPTPSCRSMHAAR